VGSGVCSSVRGLVVMGDEECGSCLVAERGLGLVGGEEVVRW
jgi:hypothetical protein